MFSLSPIFSKYMLYILTNVIGSADNSFKDLNLFHTTLFNLSNIIIHCRSINFKSAVTVHIFNKEARLFYVGDNCAETTL